MLKKLLTFIFVVLAHTQLNALPYRIETVVRILPNGQEQLIHFVSDAHIDCDLIKKDVNEASKAQARVNYFFKLIKARGKDAKVIIESFYVDPDKYQKDTPLGRVQTAYLQTEGATRGQEAFLYSLAQKLSQAHIPYTNVEFRYLVRMSDYSAISLDDYIGCMRLSEIAAFNDSSTLNEHYKKVAQYQESYYSEKRAEVNYCLLGASSDIAELNILFGLHFDTLPLLPDQLVDIFALHEIYIAQEKEVFVFMGGAHFDPQVEQCDELVSKPASYLQQFNIGKIEHADNVMQVLLQHKRNLRPFFTGGLEHKQVYTLSVAKKINEIIPIDAAQYFNDLSRNLSGYKKRATLNLGAKSNNQIYRLSFGLLAGAGIAALIYYNWATIATIWQSIFTHHSISSAHTQPH